MGLVFCFCSWTHARAGFQISAPKGVLHVDACRKNDTSQHNLRFLEPTNKHFQIPEQRLSPSYANLRQTLQNRSCAEVEERGSIPDVFSVLSRWLRGERERQNVYIYIYVYVYVYVYTYICNAGCNHVLPQIGKFNY